MKYEQTVRCIMVIQVKIHEKLRETIRINSKLESSPM